LRRYRRPEQGRGYPKSITAEVTSEKVDVVHMPIKRGAEGKKDRDVAVS